MHLYILSYIWVIPNHFDKSLHVTLFRIGQNLICISSACGFKKPDKIPYVSVCVVWLPGQGQLKMYRPAYID